MATVDTSQLSSLPLSKLSVDASGLPTVLKGPYVPLSTSTPIRMQPANQQAVDSVQDDSPYQQVIPGIPPHSLYPTLAALSTNAEIAIAPPLYLFQEELLMTLKNSKEELSKAQ